MERTKHRLDCERVFKRYDADCPRCQELASGADPRGGWSRHTVRPLAEIIQTDRLEKEREQIRAGLRDPYPMCPRDTPRG